jgi:hypothetical protein
MTPACLAAITLPFVVLGPILAVRATSDHGGHGGRRGEILSSGASHRTSADTSQASGAISPEDDAFLEDLSRRTFLFFWEQADPRTGIIRDRARTDGSPPNERSRDIGSIASVGFGLAGMCIAAERSWLPRAQVLDRTRATVRFFAEQMEQEHGWYYHFVNLYTGAREWKSELSSIDTALLLAGVLTVRRCFADDTAIAQHADRIYRRVDFRWMLAGHPTLLAHGWKPESGFLRAKWDHYCELMILYLLAIGSPTHAIPVESWRAWSRPAMTFDQYQYVSGPDPLFVHQYSTHGSIFEAGRNRGQALTGSRTRSRPRARTERSVSDSRRNFPATQTMCGESRRPTARRATSPGADLHGTRISTAPWSPRPLPGR